MLYFTNVSSPTEGLSPPSALFHAEHTQGVATNRLPVASRKRRDNSTINLEIGARSQAACGSTLTFANKMITDLTPDQQELAIYMSELSEEAYCAGWMKDLEYALWEIMNGLRTEYGRLEITDTHIQHLRFLSDSIGGWIVFDEVKEETFIPLTEWQQRTKQSQ